MAQITEQNQQTDQQNESKDQNSSSEELILVSHSSLFYWWPVWAVGFVLAAITYFMGTQETLGDNPPEYFHHSKALGITFVSVLLAVVAFTNMTLRGMVSGIFIMGALFLLVLFAWLGWWDFIYSAIPDIGIHMNFGFYIVTSTILFLMWAFTFFVFDRMTFWRVVPGQVTQEHLIGGGEQSFDVGGLVFEEFHDDPFRHYLLGFGTGDLKMTVRGAKTEEFYLKNVLFANTKVRKIQELIRRKPD